MTSRRRRQARAQMPTASSIRSLFASMDHRRNRENAPSTPQPWTGAGPHSERPRPRPTVGFYKSCEETQGPPAPAAKEASAAHWIPNVQSILDLAEAQCNASQELRSDAPSVQRLFHAQGVRGAIVPRSDSREPILPAPAPAVRVVMEIGMHETPSAAARSLQELLAIIANTGQKRPTGL